MCARLPAVFTPGRHRGVGWDSATGGNQGLHVATLESPVLRERAVARAVFVADLHAIGEPRARPTAAPRAGVEKALLRAGERLLRRLLRERSGLVLSADKQYLVESRLVPVARRAGLDGLADLVQKLKDANAEQLVIEVV